MPETAVLLRCGQQAKPRLGAKAQGCVYNDVSCEAGVLAGSNVMLVLVVECGVVER